MLEIAVTTLKEVSKENLKDIDFKELNKKMSPSELLSKSEINGISGDKSEISDILKITSNGLIRSEIDIKAELEKIKEKTTYSDYISDYITTEKELKVYQNEDLVEGKVNDRPTLKDTSIDPNLSDGKGRTNLERMEKGLAPLDENGRPYNLHHIGQKADSPLAELKDNVHKENDAILHDKTQKTEIHNEKSEVNWDKERSDHWKARAEEIKQEREQNV